VREVYDAGTSLSNARNHFTYFLVAGLAAGVLNVVAYNSFAPRSENQSGACYLMSAAAVVLDATAVVTFLLACRRIGQAGDHLHRAAVDWSRCCGGPKKPPQE